MKFLFDYLPIAIFFVTYLITKNFYIATAVLIAASFLQLVIYWLVHRKFEKLHVITFVLVSVLGGTTLFLHNEIFLKWKPSVIYWAFTIVLLGSQWFGKKTIIEKMLGDKFSMPAPVWKKLNTSWALFFLGLGAVNVWVLYNVSTKTWVYFKLFGTLGLIMVFAVGQAFFIAKHAKEIVTQKKSIKEKSTDEKSIEDGKPKAPKN